MTKEQLLQPKYEVMELYPDSPFYKGEILQLRYREHNGKVFGWEDPKRAAGIWDEDYFNQFPHLFRRLEWWEKRSIEDMPEFIKLNNEILHAHYSHNEDGSLFLHSENLCFSVGNRYYPITPATEQEYKDYISSNKSK